MPLHRPTRHVALPALAALALLIAALTAGPAHAIGNTLTVDQLREYTAAMNDPAQAEALIPKLRSFLASGPDSMYAMFARRTLVSALFTTNAPTPVLIAAIDSAAVLVGKDPRQAAFFYGQAAQRLLGRDPVPPKALEYARNCYLAMPDGGDDRQVQFKSVALATMGVAQLKVGKADSAVITLKRALPTFPDSQIVLQAIGEAYDRQKKNDLAIGYYTRACGVYLGRDSSAAAPLRTLWKKKHGSLKGMDEAIAVSYKASRQKIAFDDRMEERTAPPWSLMTLHGEPAAMSDYKGKIVVMDFWGSWCGPCRQELPIFQKVYDKYKSKGVVFLGMNWEQPQGSAEDRLKRVRDYMAQNKYTFPVVIDHNRQAVEPYGITGFPTVFIVDKTGQIRFKNVGVADGIETILQDQIDSLMD